MGIPKGGKRLVREYVVQGYREGWPPWVRLSDEEVNVRLTRHLVETTLDRLQGGKADRTAIELAVIDEVAARYSPGEAEVFAADVEAEWIFQHESGYPASTDPPEAKQGPHGSPGHVCWESLAASRSVARLGQGDDPHRC